ncbi:MAG: Transcriptional regulator, TetR family [uncultured Sulfurovum sp.]|uniref:Transcriptional regulator, TetR family n=1 Tax=uncultured Sulfurovum sp. TaxID=269237 RepID=A0A6S6S369_9BACT|nr:MAG: Transcriptional regulator, TetR family [uncultured Sulfurovum sp.]
MKVTKSAKEKTKEKILEVAVNLIIEKGFKNASMREMAKDAGISNPTIYNYFPTKEKIVFAYVAQKHQETAEILEGIEDFHTYTLREQLQTLVETELELYLEDREFILQISDMVFQSGGLKLDAVYGNNEVFTNMVADMLSIAIEAQEIPTPPFEEHLPRLFWDYYIMVVAYWLKDDSEMFENTTQFIDHSLGVVEVLLESTILNKANDLGMFLFKTHLLGALEKFSAKKRKFSKVKRKLKGVLDDQ